MSAFRPTVTVAVSAAVALAVGITPAYAASHREAPITAADPQIDSTDLYAFVSPDDEDTVTLISNWIPFEVPAGGPNFYPWSNEVRYDINIDNDHDAQPDLVYRWEFDQKTRNSSTFLYNTGPVNSLADDTLNSYQTYTLTEVDVDSGKTRTLLKNRIAAPSFVGDASMPDYETLREQATHPILDDRGQVYVGQADDPFFLDLRVFDLLYGGDLSETGNDTLDGFNVNTLALQLPKSVLARDGDQEKNPIIGVWTTARRQAIRILGKGGVERVSGPYVQVSRLGMPLVNEVVAPIGAKNLFSTSMPSGDKQFLPAVLDPEVPRLLELLYDVKAPKTPRNDLVSVFLTGVKDLNQPPKVTPSEQLRLNMSIAPNPTPDRMGVLAGDTQGFPNGRRLVDDVIDITLQVAAGELVDAPNDLGDAVDSNDVAFDDTFPYVALPHSGSTVNASASTTTSLETPDESPSEVPVAASTDDSGSSMGGITMAVILALIGLGLFAMARSRRHRSHNQI